MSSKVLTVVYSLAKGGTERAAQNFATAYSSLGLDSRVLCTQCDGIRRSFLEEKGIIVYTLATLENLDSIQGWNPDVVHLHSHGLSLECFMALKNSLPLAKFVETNVFAQPSPWIKDLDISFQLSRWCLWLYKIRTGDLYPSVSVPNPVDVDSFQNVGAKRVMLFKSAYGIREGEIVIGRIGQSYDGKWSPILVDVYNELKRLHPRLRLLLVNPPASIETKAATSPFALDIVRIESLCADSLLQDCYSSIDVFVHIADQGESFGMVLSESLLCETPVVTLATPWGDNTQGEVVGNLIGGYVVTTQKALTSYVNRLIVNPELRAQLGKAGRQRIIDLFESRVVAAMALDSINHSESLLSLNSPLNPSAAPRTPIQLMRNTVGGVDWLSLLILYSQSRFELLRYSTGYESRTLLLEFIAKRLIFRLCSLLRNLMKIVQRTMI